MSYSTELSYYSLISDLLYLDTSPTFTKSVTIFIIPLVTLIGYLVSTNIEYDM